ncbi:MAG: hypothetical protein IJD58_10230 [Lachnospiraceae bacterium]|nr:hypothetical protein [Lachnospiraceae bacterium]
MRRVKKCSIVLISVFLVACSASPDKESIDEKRTQKESSTLEETSEESESSSVAVDKEDSSFTEKETYEYISGPEDVLASQAYSVGSEIRHVDKDGKEVIRYSVTSGNIAFSAGMMMFVNGIPQSFTDEDGNSTYISNVELGANKSKTQYYTCDFNNVEEAESYVCIEKNILMPDIMIVKRRGFYMGHLQSLSNGWPHEVQCNKFTDLNIGELECNVIGDCAEGSVAVSAYIGEDELYGTVVERSDATYVELVFDVSSNGEIVIAFWGNNIPIQVGEHMYYKCSVEKGKKYSCTFKLEEELVSNIDNFFATVATLSDDMSEYGVYKSTTCIFVDKYE